MRVPSNPIGRVVDAASQGTDSLVRATHLISRVDILLTNAEELFERLAALVSRLEQRESEIGVVIRNVASSDRAARTVIDDVARTEARVEGLVDRHEPMFETIGREVVPNLQKLETVAPDLAELLAVSRALNEMMGSVPGLGRAKKRVDEELERDKVADFEGGDTVSQR